MIDFKIKSQSLTFLALTSSLGDTPISQQCSRYKCTNCGLKVNSWDELQPHHVTYIPSRVRFLCYNCHALITFLNMEESCNNVWPVKLTNTDRFRIWNYFIKTEISEDIKTISLQWFNTYNKQQRAASQTD